MNEADERDRNRQSAQTDGSAMLEHDRPVSFDSQKNEEAKGEEQEAVQTDTNVPVSQEEVPQVEEAKGQVQVDASID